MFVILMNCCFSEHHVFFQIIVCLILCELFRFLNYFLSNTLSVVLFFLNYCLSSTVSVILLLKIIFCPILCMLFCFPKLRVVSVQHCVCYSDFLIIFCPSHCFSSCFLSFCVQTLGFLFAFFFLSLCSLSVSLFCICCYVLFIILHLISVCKLCFSAFNCSHFIHLLFIKIFNHKSCYVFVCACLSALVCLSNYVYA